MLKGLCGLDMILAEKKVESVKKFLAEQPQNAKMLLQYEAFQRNMAIAKNIFTLSTFSVSISAIIVCLDRSVPVT